MLAIKLTRQVHAFLETLDPKQYRQVARTIYHLGINPYPHDSRSLKGATANEHRVDVGEYRIVYAPTDLGVEILVAAKRNDDEAYKIASRR